MISVCHFYELNFSMKVRAFSEKMTDVFKRNKEFYAVFSAYFPVGSSIYLSCALVSVLCFYEYILCFQVLCMF